MRRIVPGVRTLVLILALSLAGIRSFSQSITTADGRFEAGFGIGPLFFLGDLGGNYGVGQRAFVKDVNLSITKVAIGGFVSFHPYSFLGLRASINHGVLEGNDALISDKGGAEYFRKTRNLQFRSDVWEASLMAEVYPTVLLEEDPDDLKGKFRPYGMIGVGVFHFNPQGQYYDNNGLASWVDLQPLSLEGQGWAEYPDRKPYKLTQAMIPMGVGFLYGLTDKMAVGVEFIHRKTFTDYIDDVSTTYVDGSQFGNHLSPEKAAMAQQLYFREGFVPGGAQQRVPVVGEQRGDPRHTDAYFSTVIRCSWKLNQRDPSSYQMRCPSFY